MPARAADLGVGVGYGGTVRAEPLVYFDFEPGITVREYWLTPWAGRHYFPSGGKMPVVGRKEILAPTPAAGKRNFERSWSSFPIDTIQQPPVVYAPTYLNGGFAPPPPAPTLK